MILVAPTAFKGTLGAADAAAAMAAGATRARPADEVVELPLSDGGNGLIDAVAALGGARLERADVAGPLGDAVGARILRRSDGEAVVETADACGLHLLAADARDPLHASTRGVGELVRAAARGATRLVVGLGGSATVDGGAGMAQALGWRLLGDDDAPIPPGGEGLLRLTRIAPPASPPRLPEVVALSDVRNPLLGPQGSARVFAPQKGADAAAVERLESALSRLAERLRSDLGLDLAGRPGAGAAGGLGAGVVAFLGARLEAGADWVLRRAGFDGLLRRASLLITGEGAYDAQSGMGKVTGVILARAAALGVPALLVAGRVEARPPGAVTVVGGAGAVLDADAIRAGVARALQA